MMNYQLDLHGIHFMTRAGVPGFISRGAIQDLAGLGAHRWPDQEAAFLQRADEIERFADLLADKGMLIYGEAIIGPEHVYSVVEHYLTDIAELKQQRLLIAEGKFIPRSDERLADENDKIAALANIDAAVAELEVAANG
jgi:hypothetical protein